MRKSIFLIASAAVALSAMPAMAQSVTAGSGSFSLGTSIAVAPPNGGRSSSATISGNASTGNATAYNGFTTADPNLLQTGVNTSSSSVGGSGSTSQRIGTGGLAGGGGVGVGFGFGFGTSP